MKKPEEAFLLQRPLTLQPLHGVHPLLLAIVVRRDALAHHRWFPRTHHVPHLTGEATHEAFLNCSHNRYGFKSETYGLGLIREQRCGIELKPVLFDLVCFVFLLIASNFFGCPFVGKKIAGRVSVAGSGF